MNAIIRRNPDRAVAVRPIYSPFSLFDEIEAMLGGEFEVTTNLVPNIDLFEDKEGLTVRAEFPGVKRQDIDISLEDDVLTIKAEKKQEKETEEADYYASERSFGSYYRSMALPAHVDAETTSATFKNGLLEIRLAKAEKPEAKQIAIKVR